MKFTLTTYEAGVFQNLIFSLFFTPEISKSVDDDTKDEVQDDDDDDEVEEEIVDDPWKEQWLLMTNSE